MKTTVAKDEIGLYVEFDDWIARPLQATHLKIGDDVDAQTVQGIAVQVSGHPVFARTSEPLGEAWLRCGQRADPNKNRDNFDFFEGLGRNDVANLQKKLTSGIQPTVQPVAPLVTPRTARAMRP